MKSLIALITVAVGGSVALGGGVTGSGLVVLDKQSSGALSMVGNAAIQIPARAVYVNSSSNTAVSTTGSAVLDAPALYIVGGASFNGKSQCTGTVYRAPGPYADPLAGTAFPSTAGMTNHGAKSFSGGAAVTLSPGYYSGGISVSGNSRITFSPGVYVIGGTGLKITSGEVSGDGVCLVMQAGTLDIAGCSSLTLSPPTSGGLTGVVIAQPPSNTTGMSLAGGSGVMISGSIYAPAATLTLVGNSTAEGTGPQMGDLVVANKVSLRGTSLVKIGLPASPPIQLPSLPLFD